jgi:hypothetical protein
MYATINAHLASILTRFDAHYVPEYDYLTSHSHDFAEPDYQRRFAAYWQFRGVSQMWRTFYFAQMAPLAGGALPDLAGLLHALHAQPCTSNDRHALHFSFATKLLHVLHPTRPIYDSRIHQFYGLPPFDPWLPVPEGIQTRIQVYAFLQAEYDRVHANHLLDPAIAAFRAHFAVPEWTNQKIIDSLIWAFIGLCRQGAVVHQQVLLV